MLRSVCIDLLYNRTYIAVRWGDEDRYGGPRGPRQWWIVLPWQTAALHVISQGHVVAPHVELPFPQTEHPAQHVPRVNSYPHVHIKAGGLADKPAPRFNSRILFCLTFASSTRCTPLIKLYDPILNSLFVEQQVRSVEKSSSQMWCQIWQEEENSLLSQIYLFKLLIFIFFFYFFIFLNFQEKKRLKCDT